MLGATEDACVWAVWSGSERHFKSDTSRMRHFHPIIGHCVTGVIEAQVHVLREKRQQVIAFEPPVYFPAFHDFLPNLSFLAAGALCEILC